MATQKNGITIAPAVSCVELRARFPREVKRTAKYYLNEFKTNAVILAISEELGVVVGYCIVGHEEIMELFVYKPYRRQGIGNMLVENAIRVYGANTVSTYADNEIAQHLYKTHGFNIDPEIITLRR